MDNNVNPENLISFLKDEMFTLKSEDDPNIFLIKGIQSKFEGKDDGVFSFINKFIKASNQSIIGLKILSKLLIEKQNDLSNGFIFIMKAIKIDQTESDVWTILSQYYFKQNEQLKYYECCMKEIENQKYHTNAFLKSLIKKSIL